MTMQENFDYVQRGFRILVQSMSGYIGRELSKIYKDRWWNEVLYTLSDQRELPVSGSYGELLDSLDIANCLRLLDREWQNVFKEQLDLNCRTWAKELMGVRNIVSHIGQQDIDQPLAERALDTMGLLCAQIDPDGADEIRELYREVRARAEDATVVQYTGIAQPASASARGEMKEGSLLKLVDTELVQRTTLSRKVTYGGKTTVYPVYKVRLDALYYNDQNDRIATWISNYEAENGAGALSDLNTETYNRIIENFIYESNPDSIQKTQRNIGIVGQREPGVTLADGRIVDGNRRFTCLRRLQREKGEQQWFETVIMDVDMREDRKQIKQLELSIQHGEEKKVDYDPIDYAVGTYRDIVQTKLLTVEEYAASTNESLAEVKQRLTIAEIVSEFLEYAKVPEQYHIAREYQVYSLFTEMLAPLKQLDDEDKKKLKKIVFNNVLIKAIPDQRKFIRDLKNLIKNGTYDKFFEEQEKTGKEIEEKLSEAGAYSKAELEKFAAESADHAENMQYSMERALQQTRNAVMKAKPAENVTKSIALMLDIDTRILNKLEDEDRENFTSALDELSEIIENFRKLL